MHHHRIFIELVYSQNALEKRSLFETVAQRLRLLSHEDDNPNVEYREVFMANETELFYLVLLTLLTLIVHLILSTKNRRHDRHSHR